MCSRVPARAPRTLGPEPRPAAREMPAAASELQRPASPPAPQLQDAAALRPHGERQYLEQIEHILRSGARKEDRTGTGTLSLFGLQARYSLRGEPGPGLH